MKANQTIFFVGKCLTVSYCKKNKENIEQVLANEQVNWDEFVKVCTTNLVLTTLYCIFLKNDFLKYLPKDLVSYMKKLTEINRNRNIKILNQTKRINDLLIKENIKPVFFKGVRNLIEGLYNDIGERMIGDIDFIVNDNQHGIAFDCMLQNEYRSIVKKENFLSPFHRHLPRIVNPKEIAAVEIHKDFTNSKYSSYFNYNYIEESIINFDNYYLLDCNSQIISTIISDQVNDNRYEFNDIGIREAYDVFLMLNKCNYQMFSASPKPISKYIDFFFLVSESILNIGNPPNYLNKSEYRYKLALHKYLLSNNNQKKLFYSFIKIKIYVRNRIILICNLFLIKSYRSYFIKRILSRFNR